MVAAVALVTALIVAATSVLLRSNRDELQDDDNDPPVAIPATVVNGMLQTPDLSFEVGADVLSVGKSNDRFVVTYYNQALNNVKVFDANGVQLKAIEGIVGLALTAADSSLAAWVEPVSQADPDGTRRVVVYDVASLSVVSQTNVTPSAVVMAVAGDRAALSDDDQSWFIGAGTGLQPIAFVPNEFYVQDFDSQHLTATNLEGEVRLYNRTTGVEQANFIGALTLSLNASGDELAGVDQDGRAITAAVADSQFTQLGTMTDAFTVEWADDDSVVVRQGDLATDDGALNASGCEVDTEQCQNLPTDPEEDIIWPNDGFGQLFAIGS